MNSLFSIFTDKNFELMRLCPKVCVFIILFSYGNSVFLMIFMKLLYIVY